MIEKPDLAEVLHASEEINALHDLDALLDRVLLEARRFLRADAGSIFLRNENRLTFSYVQNDTLFRDPSGSKKHLYEQIEIEIVETSIAGYVAKTKSPLRIADAYAIDSALPYRFNSSIDERTRYRTRSILTLPLLSHGAHLSGVLQVINKSGTGGVVPFSEEDERLGNHFARSAALAIERARTTRELILRMIRMAELRDPKETGPHVNRVGSYSIELYDRWAGVHGVSGSEIKRTKDNLRMASMLHDVGKIGIPDAILKKPGRLDDAERAVMQFHSIYGARLFQNQTSDLDRMAAEICLNHHEKWDGTGYPGKAGDIYASDVGMGPGKRGEEIPILGRITALADVYDALSCRRCYKDPWPEEKVIGIIREDSGRHFDPEVVEAFFSLQDTFGAIRERYKDEG